MFVNEFYHHLAVQQTAEQLASWQHRNLLHRCDEDSIYGVSKLVDLPKTFLSEYFWHETFLN